MRPSAPFLLEIIVLIFSIHVTNDDMVMISDMLLRVKGERNVNA